MRLAQHIPEGNIPNIRKNGALNLRGRFCLSKSVPLYIYLAIGNLWNNKVCSKSACLYFNDAVLILTYLCFVVKWISQI